MSERDTGLQPERTRLAWRRTVLAVTAVALLAARLAVLPRPHPARTLVAAAALAGWLALLSVTYRRIRALAAARPAVVGRAVPLTSLAVAGYAALGIVLILI